MSLTKWAKVLGIVLIVLGILGFVPGITTADGMLLGIFHVDSLHNIVHLLTGIIALLMMKSESSARTFFKIFGIIYAIVTVLGFATGGALGMMMNVADNILHLVLAILFLWLGFKKSGGMAMSSSAPQM